MKFDSVKVNVVVMNGFNDDVILKMTNLMLGTNRFCRIREGKTNRIKVYRVHAFRSKFLE